MCLSGIESHLHNRNWIIKIFCLFNRKLWIWKDDHWLFRTNRIIIYVLIISLLAGNWCTTSFCEKFSQSWLLADKLIVDALQCRNIQFMILIKIKHEFNIYYAFISYMMWDHLNNQFRDQILEKMLLSKYYSLGIISSVNKIQSSKLNLWNSLYFQLKRKYLEIWI